LGKGNTATKTQTYTIPEDALAGTKITNTATVTGRYWSSFTASDTDSVTVTVKANPGIELTKTVDPDEQYAGENVTYTFTVTNTGNIALTDVVITDEMLEDEEGWTGDIGDLDAGCTSNITQVYTIPEGEVTITNEATVRGDYGKGEDDYVEATAIATVTVKEPEFVPEPSIELTKTVSPDRQYAGGKVTYTFTVTNTGNVPLTDIIIMDDRIVDWTETIEYLPVGEEAKITKEHIIPAGTLPGPYINTATASTLYCGECSPVYTALLEQSNGDNGSNDDENGNNGDNGGNGDNGCCQEIEATATATVTVIRRSSPGPSVTYYTLEIKIEGDGATSPGTGTSSYSSGSTVQLTPTPADGWVFVGWQGDTLDADGKITMNGNKTVTAVFEKIQDNEDKEKDEEELEDEEIPADIPEEPCIEEEPEVEKEETPAETKTLPKTGGIPSGLFYGLGALAAGSGVFIGLRKRKK
jgi:LPXTG-motif cell wall-anchored protein